MWGCDSEALRRNRFLGMLRESDRCLGYEGCDRFLGMLGVRSLFGMWGCDRCWGMGVRSLFGDVGVRLKN
ncbi:MAG: hypothetical protein HGA42_06600 [Nostocales cyanobacterium W4_Combined_metabat2_030]|jgi:hypothetical protein|nr:hypothetical protein [Nostocales cyanobacterium W4_Combined_metabat2_030]